MTKFTKAQEKMLSGTWMRLKGERGRISRLQDETGSPNLEVAVNLLEEVDRIIHRVRNGVAE